MGHAVHFGAGKIGRGFLAPLYAASGLETVFIEAYPALVESLNARRTYPLLVVSDEHTELHEITPVRAIAAGHLTEIANALATATIASTAVGAANLPRLVPALLDGMEQRLAAPGRPPLDIIVCENARDAAQDLRDALLAQATPAQRAQIDASFGFVNASVGRMVPEQVPPPYDGDPLAVAVEPYCELPVDAAAFRGPLPPIQHLRPEANFAAYVARKQFVHNLSHAATAYLGYLRGHTYIWQAIADDAVRGKVIETTDAACEALHRCFALPPDELRAHRDDLLHRYENRALGDTVARVAADPRRKLGAADRIIGAARLCEATDVEPGPILLIAAAAYAYDAPADASAVALQALQQTRDGASVLSEISGIAPDEALATEYARAKTALQEWREQRKEEKHV